MTISEFTHEEEQARAFLEFPRTLYRRDPYWIPPVRPDERRLFDATYPLLSYATVRHFLAWDRRRLCGRVSAIDNSRAIAGDRSVGYLACFECEQNSEAARMLIERAVGFLRERQVQQIRAPVDGSTWNRYRLVTNGMPGGALAPVPPHGPFLTEAYNPYWYPRLFEENDLRPVRTYHSAIIDDLDPFLEATQPMVERFDRLGYRTRSYRSRDLPLLFSLSRDIFRHNYGYTECEYEEFEAANRWSLRWLPANHVVLAFDPSGKPVGFYVAIPDYSDAVRRMNGQLSVRAVAEFLRHKGRTERLILRTVGTTPGLRHVPVGRVLFALAYRMAKRRGYRAIIHAYMMDGNESLRINEKHADRSFREYKLYGLDC